MSAMYDVLVIGGGAAGLTTAGIAAGLGAKTIMIEKEQLGGDCTWTGCIPSKTLIKSASVLHNLKKSEKYGLDITAEKISTRNIMKHVDEIRRQVYEEADKPEIFEQMGIEVVQGEATFIDDHTVEIKQKSGASTEVSARFIFICTGAKAVVPPIFGIEDIEYLTNESLFDIDNLPGSLLIIGAGPVGVEMAQSFARFGARVKVVDMAPRILMKDDPDLTEIVKKSLESDGVCFYLNADVMNAERGDEGVEIKIETNGTEEMLIADQLFIAAGRKANIDSLQLDVAGIKYTKQGITVTDTCRTSKKHIYAIGDVTGLYQFTHMSEHMAKVATTNALMKVPAKIDHKHVPRVTYSQPELAQVGATEKELTEKGTKFEVYRFPFSKIDRAITDGNTTGLIKVFAKKWSGKILGASIAGAQAGEMISLYALAMRNGISLRSFADTIYPYPTYGLGARRAADQWYIKHQTETVVKWVRRVFRYRGQIPDLNDPNRIV